MSVTPLRPVMPSRLDAERALLGGVLLFGKAFQEIADLVEPEDFYNPVHGAIFQAMVDLDLAAKPIDLITLPEQMRTNDTHSSLRAFNGEAYFGELSSAAVTVENITAYARMVRGASTARRLIEAVTEIRNKGLSDYGEIDEYVEESERSVFAISQRSQRQNYELVQAILPTTIRNLESRYERKEAVTGVPSGYIRLDRLTAGFQPSDLVIVAGRPSMGKTSLAMNAAQNAAIDHRIPVLVFSLEMSKEALVERMICCEARVDSMRLRTGFLDGRDWINITKATSRIADAPIWIDDSASPSLNEIRAKARRWRADSRIFPVPHGHGLIVIDYMQLISPPSPGRGDVEQNREREVAGFSRGLKALAKELRLPVVALSQLNRGPEARADKRPNLADLRDSGAIEQDADVIAFLYRDEVYNKDSPDRGTAEVIVGKQRNGAIGVVRLAFLEQYTRFENLAEGRSEDDISPPALPPPSFVDVD